MKYVFLANAMDDVRDAAAFYDSQRDGLGLEFLIEVGIGIARVLDAPQTWPELEAGVHKYRLDRFPFGILYQLSTPTRVTVVAVFDLRRKPGSWRR